MSINICALGLGGNVCHGDRQNTNMVAVRDEE